MSPAEQRVLAIARRVADAGEILKDRRHGGGWGGDEVGSILRLASDQTQRTIRFLSPDGRMGLVIDALRDVEAALCNEALRPEMKVHLAFDGLVRAAATLVRQGRRGPGAVAVLARFAREGARAAEFGRMGHCGANPTADLLRSARNYLGRNTLGPVARLLQEGIELAEDPSVHPIDKSQQLVDLITAVIRELRDDSGGGGGGRRVTIMMDCQSDEYQLARCYVPQARDILAVELNQQYSRAACVEGRTFGAEGNSLWASRGCRGNFRVTYLSQ